MAIPTLKDREAARARPTNINPVMYQSWQNLLFLHWKWDPSEIQKSLPQGIYVDTYKSDAYLGIVPFFMCNVRPRGCPAIPGISNFMELNLRTYVYDEKGNPGVWFYSLDANQWLAVKIARKFFNLPYFNAKMSSSFDCNTGWIDYASQRKDSVSQLEDKYRYRSVAKLGVAQPDTLDFFLLERYFLFNSDKLEKRLFVGQVFHKPYLMYEVELAEFSENLIQLAGLQKPLLKPDHITMAKKVDVEIFRLKEILRS